MVSSADNHEQNRLKIVSAFFALGPETPAVSMLRSHCTTVRLLSFVVGRSLKYADDERHGADDCGTDDCACAGLTKPRLFA